MYGRRLPKAELFARIDAVDGATIRAVADRFIYDQVGNLLYRCCLHGRQCANHVKLGSKAMHSLGVSVGCWSPWPVLSILHGPPDFALSRAGYGSGSSG